MSSSCDTAGAVNTSCSLRSHTNTVTYANKNKSTGIQSDSSNSTIQISLHDSDSDVQESQNTTGAKSTLNSNYIEDVLLAELDEISGTQTDHNKTQVKKLVPKNICCFYIVFLFR